MARKRGKGGRFVKGGKGPKKKRTPKASSGGGGGAVPISLLHKIDRSVSRIEHRLVPKRVKDRLHRMKSKAAERAQARKEHELNEAALAAKYG